VEIDPVPDSMQPLATCEPSGPSSAKVAQPSNWELPTWTATDCPAVPWNVRVDISPGNVIAAVTGGPPIAIAAFWSCSRIILSSMEPVPEPFGATVIV